MGEKVVLDASALMAALLPGEPLKERARQMLRGAVAGEIELLAPTLLSYEVANSLLKAERSKGHQVAPQATDTLLQKMEELELSLVQVPPHQIVQAARKYGCWGYDAAYLALAENEGIQLITADKRLYNSVRSEFDGIQYLGG